MTEGASAPASSSAAAAAQDDAGGEDAGGSGGGGVAGMAESSSISLFEASPSNSSLASSPAATDTAELALQLTQTLPTFESAVTAVAFAPVYRVSRDSTGRAHSAATVLAIGLESGSIQIWSGRTTTRASAAAAAESPRSAPPTLGLAGTWAWSCQATVPLNIAHADAVRGLAWRPPPVHGSVKPLRFAARINEEKGGRKLEIGDLEASLQLATCSDDESIRILRIWTKL